MLVFRFNFRLKTFGIDEEEPYINRINTSQDKYNQNINNKTIEFIKNKFISDLLKMLKKLIGEKNDITVAWFIFLFKLINNKCYKQVLDRF